MRVAVVLAVIFMSSMFSSGSVAAADRVVLDGREVGCTTRCVASRNPGGGWNVSDCCGGRVRWVINPVRTRPS